MRDPHSQALLAAQAAAADPDAVLDLTEEVTLVRALVARTMAALPRGEIVPADEALAAVLAVVDRLQRLVAAQAVAASRAAQLQSTSTTVDPSRDPAVALRVAEWLRQVCRDRGMEPGAMTVEAFAGWMEELGREGS